MKITALQGVPLWIVLLATSCGWSGSVEQKSSEPANQGIERLDPRIDRLIPVDAKLEKLAEGFQWAEGPLWVADGGYLLFSDVLQNSIFRWSEQEGLRLFRRPSGFTGTDPPGRETGSNGLTLDGEGRLVMCQHGDRQVARLEVDGTETVLVSRFEGKRLNSPNDLVFDSSGALYFTDPPYGLDGLNDNPRKELGFNGVYRLAPSGELQLLTSELTFPNGIAFSPDEAVLYVANSDPQRAVWMAYDVAPDGTLANGRVFFDATAMVGKLPGLPDGLKVDQQGNLFATGPGGVYIFALEGTLLGRINPGVATANCAWGNDGRTLYLTADSFLYRIRLSTHGTIPGSSDAE